MLAKRNEGTPSLSWFGVQGRVLLEDRAKHKGGLHSMSRGDQAELLAS